MHSSILTGIMLVMVTGFTPGHGMLQAQFYWCIFTSSKTVMFWCSCLFVCVYDYSKTNHCIFMYYFMWVEPEQRKKWWNFGKDSDHTLDTKKSEIFSSLILNGFHGYASRLWRLKFERKKKRYWVWAKLQYRDT